jgi:para-aminobenzoate synthetase
MKILVLDNGSIRLAQLVRLCRRYGDTHIAGLEDDYKDILSTIDMVVLSGGPGNPVRSHRHYFHEAELIREFHGGIIGICLGFELIAHVYGAHLVALPSAERGIAAVTVSRADPILDGITDFRAFEAHRWAIKSVRSPLIELARSPSGVQIIRHSTRPVWGMQFHPEVTEPQSHGRLIFGRIIDEYAREHASTLNSIKSLG